jgi:hypothetical protein
LIIPFDKLAPIQAAYRSQRAFEGGLHLGRGVADARFMAEMKGVAALESAGEVAEALALFRELSGNYPDSSLTAKARYAFSQVIYNRADRVATGESVPGFDRPGLIDEVLELMTGFLARFPTHPEAPAAVFSVASALLERNQSERSLAWGQVGIDRHRDSDLGPAIAYLKAYAHFKLGQYGASLELCQQVVEHSDQEESRDMATYIMAQIHHARGEFDQALEMYRKVQDRFQDAAETIQELTEEHFEIQEVVEAPSGASASLPMKLRNIPQVDLRIYRVDLMKLYLLKGSLDELSNVNLAGIRPIASRALKFDTRHLTGLRAENVRLELPGKGAYLVLVRAGSTSTHALVLAGGLACDVSEDAGEGRVRVTVRDERGKPVVGARVQLKGSEGDRFLAGETDLRGIFLADGLQGTVTAIASHRGAYALYRGTEQLKLALNKPRGKSPKIVRGTKIDFDDETVEGELVRPDGETIEARKRAQGFFKQAEDVDGMAAEQAK